MRDPAWWTPHTDDYAATYDDTPRPTGPDDAEPDDDDNNLTIGEDYADHDAAIRFTIERGRPGYTDPAE